MAHQANYQNFNDKSQKDESSKKYFTKTKEGNTRLVQEEGGKPVTLGLKQTNPFKKAGCAYGD